MSKNKEVSIKGLAVDIGELISFIHEGGPFRNIHIKEDGAICYELFIHKVSATNGLSHKWIDRELDFRKIVFFLDKIAEENGVTNEDVGGVTKHGEKGKRLINPKYAAKKYQFFKYRQMRKRILEDIDKMLNDDGKDT